MRAIDSRSSTGCYEKSSALPDGAERNKLYHEMTRMMEVDTVWILGRQPLSQRAAAAHVVGFKKHPILHAEWVYLDLDQTAESRRSCGASNE